MTRTAEARLKLSALDRTGGAFASISGRFGKLANQAAKFNRQTSLMNRSVRSLNKGLVASAARTATFLAPAVLTAGAVAATKRFATFERALQRLVITGEATDDQIGAVRDRIEEVADVAALPIENVKQGFASLLEAGKTVEEALKLLESTSVAAQASDAQAADLATTIIAVGDNLGIAADRAQIAFDIMIKGGKLGKFELKDMAQHLPGLVPQFANLGLKGEEGLKRLVAMMQTVRLQTGDAGQAATALGDLFQKMEVDTVQKKFSKFGIDVRASLARARREGRDLIEVFLDLAKEATNGDLSKLPQLIPDKEMRRAVNALLQERGRLKGFEKELDSAAGETVKDLARLTDDAEAKFVRLGNSWDKLVRRIGGMSATVLLPAIDMLNKGLDPKTYQTLRDDPMIAMALKPGGTTFGLSKEQIAAITKEKETLNAEIMAITAKGDKATGMENSALHPLKMELSLFEDALKRIKSQGPDGTRFDFVGPVIQASSSPFPDDPSKKFANPVPVPRPTERLPIGRPVSNPRNALHLGTGPRVGSDPAVDDFTPRKSFKFVSAPKMDLDVDDAKEARRAFAAIEDAADIDLTNAGDKAMGGFVTGFEQQAEKAVSKAEETHARIQQIMSRPFTANIKVNGPQANVGRSMPHIDANGDG